MRRGTAQEGEDVKELGLIVVQIYHIRRIKGAEVTSLAYKGKRPGGSKSWPERIVREGGYDIATTSADSWSLACSLLTPV